jgi:thiamine pyrophosphokinase
MTMRERRGHALVLGDGDAPTRAGLDAAWPGWDEDVSLVVAADGGARLAEQLGLSLDRWVGDADSFPRAEVDRLAAAGVEATLVPGAKDESDLELAVMAAADRGVSRITVLGALRGPRLDHELANVALLAHPALARIDVELLDDRTRVRLIAAIADGPSMTAHLAGRTGDLVSLLPLDSAVEGVTTEALLYPLADEPLGVGPARGLSNVRTAPDATVTVRAGRLLVIETPATVDR